MVIITEFEAPFGAIPELRLQHIPRWAIIKMAKRQSVAEHAFNVARIVMWLIQNNNIILKGNYDAYVVEALLHDDDEVYTGDIPTLVKQKEEGSSNTSDIVKLADILESLIFFEDNCIDTENVKKWIRYKLRNSLRTQIDKIGIQWLDVSCLFE